MLIEEIKKIKSGRKELHEFALTLATCLGLLAILLAWRHKNYAPFAVSAFAFLLGGILRPLWLAPVHKIWMTIALAMGAVMTRVILGVLFYAVLTPLSVIAHLAGKTFLDLSFKKKTDSYWIPRVQNQDKKRSETQF